MQNPTLPIAEAAVGQPPETPDDWIDAPDFRRRLLAWYDRHGRQSLPWKLDPQPYRVWVSEIMLQQTQVATVIPYFERFMARFPSLESLAGAELDEVLKHWAGLGYYARARNLHGAARRVAERFAGRMPEDPEQLLSLPGIGRSTAGAILSLGFGLRAAILDGNVKRVLCRFAGIEAWPGEGAILARLWRLSEHLTPAWRVGDYNQAMMDLGAGPCARRRPDCGVCPLATACLAHARALTASIPAGRPARATPTRQCFMLLLRDRRGRVYLERRPPVGIWGGLWAPPEFEREDGLRLWCHSRGIDCSGLERLDQRRHTFTHFKLDYQPVLVRAEMPGGVAESAGICWWERGAEIALPTPIRQLLAGLP